MKSKSFSDAKQFFSPSPGLIKWAKETRARGERRYTKRKLKNISDDFDLMPNARHKPGFWAWVISLNY